MTESKHITIPYGHGHSVGLRVPRANLGDVLNPNQVALPSDGDLVIAQALNLPIASPVLEELARGKRRPIVIVDDLTRPTPVARVLPQVLQRLNAAGIGDAAITIVIALGTHRPMTEKEISARLGAEIVGRVRVINSNFADKELLTDCGQAPDGTRLWVDRRVMDADLRIAIGTILPHPTAGWGGGAKIIYPGVGGEETVSHYHLQQTQVPYNMFGDINSPVRANMERWVGQIGLHFIVNVICTPGGQIYKAVAGHFIQAHRQGVAYAREVCAVRAKQRADIVVSSSYPADLDFWQAGKGLMSAEILVRDGGLVILVTPCPEGIGPHPELPRFVGDDDPEDVARRAMAGEFADAVVAAACVSLARMRQRARYAIVSAGLTAADCHEMKYLYFASLQEAVDWALAEYGPTARLSVIPYGAETLPLLDN